MLEPGKEGFGDLIKQPQKILRLFLDMLECQFYNEIFCYRSSWKLWQQQFAGQAVESYWHPVPALPHVDVHAREEGGRRGGGGGRQQLHLHHKQQQQHQQQQHQQQQQPGQHQQWSCPPENKSASLPNSRRRPTLHVGCFLGKLFKFFFQNAINMYSSFYVNMRFYFTTYDRKNGKSSQNSAKPFSKIFPVAQFY